MILGKGEETIDDLLNMAGCQQGDSNLQATAYKPSIPVDLRRVNGEEIPKLSSMSLKKVRKKTLDQVDKEVISCALEKRAGTEAKLRHCLTSVTNLFLKG